MRSDSWANEWDWKQHWQTEAPSRESLACSRLRGTVISSSRVTSCLVHNAELNSSACSGSRSSLTCVQAKRHGALTPRDRFRVLSSHKHSGPTSCSDACEAAATCACSSASDSNSICAKSRTAARVRMTATCSCAFMPMATIAPLVRRNSAASSRPSMAIQPLWFRRANFSMAVSRWTYYVASGGNQGGSAHEKQHNCAAPMNVIT